jgi:hypothetical protein
MGLQTPHLAFEDTPPMIGRAILKDLESMVTYDGADVNIDWPPELFAAPVQQLFGDVDLNESRLLHTLSAACGGSSVKSEILRLLNWDTKETRYLCATSKRAQKKPNFIQRPIDKSTLLKNVCRFFILGMYVCMNECVSFLKQTYNHLFSIKLRQKQ